MLRDQIPDKLHIGQLSPMQQDVAHALLNTESDVLVLSPTGSGKTLAYLLPLAEMLSAEQPEVQAVVVVPGRELALQSATVVRDMGCGLRAMAVYGGRPAMDEHRQLRERQPHVIFGTPGRLNDHLAKGNFSTSHVRLLVLDEYDKCLEMGFYDEMKTLLRNLPHVGRHVLLSATEGSSPLLDTDRFVRIDYLAPASAASASDERVSAFTVESPEKDKLQTLAHLLGTLGEESSIVFLNHRDSVERTDQFLRELGFTTSAFHGGMEQKQREDALYKFSNGSANVMVSTNLASRGLDIPHVGNIIHYHLPESEEEYVHRVGRTARWESTGKTFFILSPGEELPPYVDIPVAGFTLPQAGLTVPVPQMATIYIGKGKKDKISKGDIVGFLCKKGGLKNSEIGRIDVKDRYAYAAIRRDKINQVLRQTSGEKIKGIKTLCEVVK